MKQNKSIVDSIGGIFDDQSCLGCLVMPFCVILAILFLPFLLLRKKKITVSAYGDLSVYPLEFEKKSMGIKCVF